MARFFEEICWSKFLYAGEFNNIEFLIDRFVRD
jgi:hypothetical protein